MTRAARKAWLRFFPVLTLLMLALVGGTFACSSLLHFSDPTAQSISCLVTGALLPELEAIAAAEGLPLSVVQALFTSACNESAQHAATQAEAEHDALLTVQSMARKLHRMGAVFTSADAGAP